MKEEDIISESGGWCYAAVALLDVLETLVVANLQEDDEDCIDEDKKSAAELKLWRLATLMKYPTINTQESE